MRRFLIQVGATREYVWRYGLHTLFGHPKDKHVGPWCECMGVYNACDDVIRERKADAAD